MMDVGLHTTEGVRMMSHSYTQGGAVPLDDTNLDVLYDLLVSLYGENVDVDDADGNDHTGDGTAADGEAKGEFVQDNLYRLVADVEGKARLEPLAAALFAKPKKALVKMVKEITGDDAEKWQSWRRKTSAERVRALARWHRRDSPAGARAVIEAHLYAAQTSSRRYRMDEASPTEVRAAIKAATGIDLADPSADRPDPGTAPAPLLETTTDDGRQAISYSVPRRSQESLDRGFHLQEAVRQEVVTLLISSDGTIETRGPAGQTARAMKAFQADLRKGGLERECPSRKLTEEQLSRVISKLGGVTTNVETRNATEVTDGVKGQIIRGSTMPAWSDKDLKDRPGFEEKAGPDPDITAGDVDFKFGGKTYRMHVSANTGAFWFRRSETSEAVIRHVYSVVDEVLATPAGGGASS